MPICKKCNGYFSRALLLNGKKHILGHRKYCLMCSPFGTHNTRKIEIPKEQCRTCERCGKQFVYKSGCGRAKNICSGCAVVEHRRRIKKRAVESKGGRCELCGYNRCVGSMVFHHRNKKEKDFGISGITLSWARIKKELKKCVLLCTNCHGEVHAGMICLEKI